MTCEEDGPRVATRRGLLAGAAATAATAAGAGLAAPAGAAPRRRRADVVVVGAGLSGLIAARDVAAAGRSVLVVEASGRVGGRIRNVSIGGGEVVEGGAEYIGPTQSRMAALAAQLGVATFPAYNTGSNLYVREGRVTPYDALGLPPDPEGLPDAGGAIAKLDALAAEVDLDAPWRSPRAREWDAQTLETWLLANTTTASGRLLLDVAVTSVFSFEPRELSLLFVLFYIRAAGDQRRPGSLVRLISVAGGAQERRFAGGSQRIPLALAERLGRRRLILDAPVRRIAQSGSGVRLEAGDTVVRGRQVIVALPTTLAGRIAYAPALPARRDQLTQRLPCGSVIKVHAVYDRPFWRDAGLTGQIVSDAGPARVSFDNSPPRGRRGVLMAFIEASDARAYAGRPQALRAAALENFSTAFGARAARPRRFLITDWDAEPYSRGGPVGCAGPGVLTGFGAALRRPVGRIHWAGTDTATHWNGYMEGALRAGERAAREALRAL